MSDKRLLATEKDRRIALGAREELEPLCKLIGGAADLKNFGHEGQFHDGCGRCKVRQEDLIWAAWDVYRTLDTLLQETIRLEREKK